MLAASTTRQHLNELSYAVIGAAIGVRSTLGYGFAEKIYENALCVALRRLQIPFEQQPPVEVRFEEEIVGVYVPDLIIERSVIVEIKATDVVQAAFRRQVVNYLCATGLTLGLVLNFGPRQLETARVVNGF